MTSDTLIPLGEKSPLPAETSNPLRLIAVALLLGWSVDYFFYDHAFGLSFPVFIALGALIMLGVAIVERVRPALSSLWLLIPMVAHFAANMLESVGLRWGLSYFLAAGVGIFALQLVRRY